MKSDKGELSQGMCPTPTQSLSQLASHAGHIELGRRGKLFPVAEARRDGYEANGAASERERPFWAPTYRVGRFSSGRASGREEEERASARPRNEKMSRAKRTEGREEGRKGKHSERNRSFNPLAR